MIPMLKNFKMVKMTQVVFFSRLNERFEIKTEGTFWIEILT